MRLRDLCVLGGAILVLFGATGCGRNRGLVYKPADQEHRADIKTKAATPQEKARDQVALAQEYIQEGQLEVALDDVQKALKLDPSSAEAYSMLGYIDERIGRLDQAGIAYEKSAKLAPNSGNILNNYGGWLCHSGHPAEADPQFRKALADPFYKTPVVALGNAASCAFKAGNLTLAEAYSRQILAVNPNNGDALEAMARIKYQQADYMHARAFIERLLGAPKVDPESLDLAAQIEDRLGDQDGARTYRTRLTAEFPQYTPQKF